MATPFLTERELEFLRALGRSNVRFMVVGLSAAALQGAPVVTQDVHLWFEDLGDARLAAALREIGAAYVPPFGLNPPMFAGAGTELFDIVLRMDGLGNFASELPNTREVRVGDVPLRVLALDRIIASKRAANRPKDNFIMQVLEDAVATAGIGERRTGRKRPKSKTKPGS